MSATIFEVGVLIFLINGGDKVYEEASRIPGLFHVINWAQVIWMHLIEKTPYIMVIVKAASVT